MQTQYAPISKIFLQYLLTIKKFAKELNYIYLNIEYLYLQV